MNKKIEFKPTKRIYLDDAQKTVEVTIRLPGDLYEKVTEQAKKRGLSTASYVREALMTSIDVSPEEEKEIKRLLEDCSTEEGFEIEGEDGFLNQVIQRNLRGEIWTPKQLDKVAVKFFDGWEGYFVQPEAEDLAKRFRKAMNLDKRQAQYFDGKVVEIAKNRGFPEAKTTETEEESAEEEEF